MDDKYFDTELFFDNLSKKEDLKQQEENLLTSDDMFDNVDDIIPSEEIKISYQEIKDPNSIPTKELDFSQKHVDDEDRFSLKIDYTKDINLFNI
jgi:hypothetical protein